MPLLTEADRAYILNQLKFAPDSVLADAMLAFNSIRDKMVAVRKLIIGVDPSVPDTEKTVVNEVPAERPNINPGKPSITKIGGPAKSLILEELSTGSIQPHAKYAEHMKLLWSRGEVKFDGKEYYL